MSDFISAKSALEFRVDVCWRSAGQEIVQGLHTAENKTKSLSASNNKRTCKNPKIDVR